MATTAGTLVLKYLIGDYPASRDELVARAIEQGADQAVLGAVRHLPDIVYDSPSAVRWALEHHEHHQ
jgi:hypothetical protein